MFKQALNFFGLDEKSKVTVLGQGLINTTWKVSGNGRDYVLQKVNEHVFKHPEDIAYNSVMIAGYLAEQAAGYLFAGPELSSAGEAIARVDEGCFRLFRFIEGSHTLNTISTAGQAYEAAKQFGKFTGVLKDFDSSLLKLTIPSFHDLSLRNQQFLKAIKTGNNQRIQQSVELIKQLLEWSHIVRKFEWLTSSAGFKLRVTHHDTKISNVLFDEDNKGICVIDLDTVMPGYFISDVGDMMRTYLSPVSEEEADFGKIEVRDEVYEAVTDGYLSAMQNELTAIEKANVFYAGQFMIYMQAIRFLTDHLLNDEYYGAKYPNHNFIRAKNQVVLMQRYLEKQKTFNKKGAIISVSNNH